MHFLYILSFLFLFSSSSVSAGVTIGYGEEHAVLRFERRDLVRRNVTTAVPSCAASCLDTYMPQYCNSTSNTTCFCSNANLTATITACVYTPCNITDILQFQRYSAEKCGVKNDKSKINEVLLMDYIVPALTTVFVAGRVCARITLDVGLGWDDWVLVSAYFTYMVAVATSLGLILNRFGEHLFWLTTDQVIRAMKFFFYTELFYMLSITLTKLSLLLFFLRIFPSQRLLKVSWTLGAFIVMSNLAIMGALAFQCVPFHGYWTNWMYKENPVKCIDQFATLNVAAALGIFHNLAILVLPLPTLWTLNLPWQRKLNLLVMFSVGSVVVVCSCLRLPSLATLRVSDDISYDQAPIIVWSHLEQGVGLITACLPACRSLIEYFIPSLKMSHLSSRNKTNGTVYPGPGSKHAALGTSARSFIELHDRMPDMENGVRESGDMSEKVDAELSLQEILAGAPSSTCKKGGCRKLGYGHETRVAGGGRELPESVFVPVRELEERGVRASGETRSGEAWDKDSESVHRGEKVLLSGCNGEKKEGVIVCTKTIEYSHEKI